MSQFQSTFVLDRRRGKSSRRVTVRCRDGAIGVSIVSVTIRFDITSVVDMSIVHPREADRIDCDCVTVASRWPNQRIESGSTRSAAGLINLSGAGRSSRFDLDRCILQEREASRAVRHMHSLGPISKVVNGSSRSAIAFMRYAPPLPIRSLVESIWTFSAGPGERGLTDCIPPDICSEIICRIGSEPFVVVRGPQLQHGEIEISPGASYVGARLKPGVASWLLRAPANDVCGARIELTAKGTALCGRTRTAAMERTACDVVERFIHGLVEVFTQRGCAPRATIGMAAAQIISSANGRITADAVASALGCCTRHLRREMIGDIGIGPKAAARISRIRFAIALLGASTDPPARVAVDAGYSDQAHMTREFAILKAPSPATMRSWVESDSFNTSAPAHS